MNIAYSTPLGRQNKPGRPKPTHFLERDKDDEDNAYGNGVYYVALHTINYNFIYPLFCMGF